MIVVGAGPSGSTAAKFLAEKGFNVLLLDKEKFPRYKPCGGGLPMRVLNRFPYIEEKDLIESYSFGGFAYASSLKFKVKLQSNKPIAAMVLRKKFDYDLVKLAIDSGTTFIDGKSAEDIKILEDKAKILLNDGTNIESKIVIGADGILSTIAKKSGLSHGHKNVGICVFQECPMSIETLDRFFGEKRLCHIHMKFQRINGYGWIFPKREHLNIGICVFKQGINQSEGKINLKTVYKNYITTLKKSKIIPDDFKIENVKGGILPIYPLEKTYSDRIVLCGDAAGFINPLSGEGIYYAMSSGEIAARVVSEALESGETNERFLSKYKRIWKNDFGRDIKLLLSSAIQSAEGTDKLLELTKKDKKLADMILGVLTGDLSIYKHKWKLFRRYLYVKLKVLFKL